MLHVFCLCSDIGLVCYSAGVDRTSCYTIITICCACFVFALILWFGLVQRWSGENRLLHHHPRHAPADPGQGGRGHLLIPSAYQVLHHLTLSYAQNNSTIEGLTITSLIIMTACLVLLTFHD
jgi:hypothetical protein